MSYLPSIVGASILVAIVGVGACLFIQEYGWKDFFGFILFAAAVFLLALIFVQCVEMVRCNDWLGFFR